jgi:hypothetical protein
LRPPSSHTTGRTHRIRRFRLMVERLASQLSSHRSSGSSRLRCWTPGLVLRSRRRGSCDSAKATDRVTPFPSLPRGAAWPGLALWASPALPPLNVAPTLRVVRDCFLHQTIRPFVHRGEGNVPRRLPRRTTTASADFCTPVTRRCRRRSPYGQACRSPRVSLCVLGSGPAGFTLVASE